jgi:hypothetical protein
MDIEELAEMIAEKGDHRVTIDAKPLHDLCRQYVNAEGVRQSFRKAASDMAIEAGVIAAPVKGGDDVYVLQLLAESQLSMRRLSVRYEKLRAAAIGVLEAQGSITATARAIEVLRDET